MIIILIAVLVLQAAWLLWLNFLLKKRNQYILQLISENEKIQHQLKWKYAAVCGLPASLPPKKARIVKSESDMWYKDKIGEEIEIASFGTFGMHTIDGKYVIFNDVEFL